MKKSKFCFFLIIQWAMFTSGFAQNTLTADWLINSTANGWSVVSDQAADNDGNIFLTGYYDTVMAFGSPSERLQSDQSVFVARVNPKGGVVWMKKISSTGFCYSASIITTKGSIFITGNFMREMIENGVSLKSPGTRNAFIIKLDSKGKIVWGTSINGSFGNQHLFLAQDENGSIVFAGSFKGELTYDDNLYDSRYYCDIALAKLDEKTGKIIALRVFEGKSDDLVNDLIISPKGEIIITGSFQEDLIAGDKTLISNGKKDAFLVMMDENLQFVSTWQMGGYYDDFGKALAFDHRGNLLLAGSFSGSLVLNDKEVLMSNGKLDAFLTKFDLTGEPIWSKSFGGAANDYVNALDINDSNDIYITGSYRGIIENDIQKIRSADFSTDIFLAKFDKNGNLHFIESLGGNNDDFPRALSLDNSNNILVSGNYSDDMEVPGEKTENSPGKNLFLTKLHDCSLVPPIQLPGDTIVFGDEFGLSVDEQEVVDQKIKLAYLLSNNPTDDKYFKLSASEITTYGDQDGKIQIFPNPVDEEVNVSYKDQNSISEIPIQIYNEQGQLVFTDKILTTSSHFTCKINVKGLLNGIYLLLINSGNTAIIHKIVVQH